jgi:Helix-turn-helix domain
MSRCALDWAIEADVPDVFCRIVLILLANRLNARTGRCDPSLHRLAREAMLSKATLCRALNELERLGLIARQQRRDPGTRSHQSTNYILNMPTLVSVRDKGLSPTETSLVSGGDTNLKEPTPLPPGWSPNRNDVAEMQRRFPNLTSEHIHAATERFITWATGPKHPHVLDWDQRYRAWLSEDGADGSHTRRAKRTASRASRSEQLSERNSRRANEALARLAALSNRDPGGD